MRPREPRDELHILFKHGCMHPPPSTHGPVGQLRGVNRHEAVAAANGRSAAAAHAAASASSTAMEALDKDVSRTGANAQVTSPAWEPSGGLCVGPARRISYYPHVNVCTTFAARVRCR